MGQWSLPEFSCTRRQHDVRETKEDLLAKRPRAIEFRFGSFILAVRGRVHIGLVEVPLTEMRFLNAFEAKQGARGPSQ